jgi:hypothetical protein
MSSHDASEQLNDLLLNGIQAELYWAEEARAVSVMIGVHSPRINETRFGSLFGRLQEVFSERETLAISKLFDRPSRKYVTRSIASVLDLLEVHIADWNLEERQVLEDALIKNGRGDFSLASDRDLMSEIVNFYRSNLPMVEKKQECELSAALDRVFQSRDKVHAHNEAVPAGSRQLPSWKDTELLFEFAREFAQTIGHGTLGIALVAPEPLRTAKQLELILALGNLSNEEFRSDKSNAWMLQRLRKELSLEN